MEGQCINNKCVELMFAACYNKNISSEGFAVGLPKGGSAAGTGRTR